MKWSEIDISFGPKNHLETKLSNWNLPFVVKLLIRHHKVEKTLIDNGASLNLIKRKTFIEMGLNLSDLTLVHDTFQGVIPGHSSTPIGRIDLEVSCGPEDNKHREMLMFEVAMFDIGYYWILGRPFLVKFMAVIHTTYAIMKKPRPKGIITIKADQRDALACEDASLSHAVCFSDKATQNQAAKTQGGSVPRKTSTLKPPTNGILWAPTSLKGTYIASTPSQPPADQQADGKKKGTTIEEDKEILADPNNSEKKLQISSNLDPK
jgi:hypothetical protein